MTTEDFNKEDYEAQIADLKKQLEDAKEKQTNDDDLSDIKAQYDKIIKDKDDEIEKLKKTNKQNKKKIDDTVTDLNKEVQEKLEQSEAYKELLSTVEELQKERAETIVDNYIQKGVLTPAQKDTAVKLCLNDNETFMNLYKDAQPIVDIKNQKSKKINADITRLRDYFKN